MIRMSSPSSGRSEPSWGVLAEGVSYRYGEQQALDGLNLKVANNRITALLGPNGSGTSTLFRLMATLMPMQSGRLEICGHCVTRATAMVRQQIGIVFQSASLDGKLTVAENLACQAALYGLRGTLARQRIDQVVEVFRLADYRQHRCQQLSGGWQRRVEVAKGFIHRPRMLLLDEPSTGLDPVARLELWSALRSLNQEFGTGVLLTTHLMEEADKADSVAIIHQGRLAAVGSPSQLRDELGSSVLVIESEVADQLQTQLRDELQLDSQRVEQQLRISHGQPAALVPQIIERFGPQLRSLTVGQPSLEDVFIARTGYRLQARVGSEN
jgi:ABC-2 type transport system ATP-binding protein